jgi:predicted RNase H-like HicB family nuclease
MHWTIESERESDGRWLAEVPEIPGALAYGETRVAAMAKAEALALRALAERLEAGELGPKMRERVANHSGLTPQDL